MLKIGTIFFYVFRRYDVTAALVGCPPASPEADEPRLSDSQESEALSPGGGGGGSGSGYGSDRDEGRRAWVGTPNAELLDALSR